MPGVEREHGALGRHEELARPIGEIGLLRVGEPGRRPIVLEPVQRGIARDEVAPALPQIGGREVDRAVEAVGEAVDAVLRMRAGERPRFCVRHVDLELVDVVGEIHVALGVPRRDEPDARAIR